MSLNSVTLMGRLTAQPELKTTQSGVSVTSFCIAVDRKYQPQGQEKKADFIDIVAWRNTAEFICKYFQKGSMIGIEGEIQTRTYTDQDGKNRKVTEILVNNASFCESKSSTENQGGSKPAVNGVAAYGMPSDANFEEIPNDESLPF
jgi:single-strand DNA-binding protein